MFEVEYLCNGYVKKNGVNANLVLCDWLTLDTSIDFAFSPRLSRSKKLIFESPLWGVRGGMVPPNSVKILASEYLLVSKNTGTVN